MGDYIKLFEKFIELIDWETLQYSTFKLNTDYKVWKFFTKDHLKSMIYFHLAELKGLRELYDYSFLSTRLKAVIKGVSLGNLSHHNNKRDFEVFLPVMNELISRALVSLPVNETMKKFGVIKLIDSTTISMCFNFYKWALFRENKAGIKIHTEFDLNKGIPETIIVSNAEEHDVTKIDDLTSEKHCIHIWDKGYVDYKRYDKFTKDEKYFVTRLKDNSELIHAKGLKVTHSKEKLLDDKAQIIFDKVVKLGSKPNYITTEQYRIIKIVDASGKELTFLTNLMEFSSEEIAWLYKKRWEIELFFKWIKQNLKFKTMIGHSLNAVMIQIITGIMTFVMLKMLEAFAPLAYGLLKIKRKLKLSLMEPIHCDLFSWYKWFDNG